MFALTCCDSAEAKHFKQCLVCYPDTNANVNIQTFGLADEVPVAHRHSEHSAILTSMIALLLRSRGHQSNLALQARTGSTHAINALSCEPCSSGCPILFWSSRCWLGASLAGLPWREWILSLPAVRDLIDGPSTSRAERS